MEQVLGILGGAVGLEGVESWAVEVDEVSAGESVRQQGCADSGLSWSDFPSSGKCGRLRRVHGALPTVISEKQN